MLISFATAACQCPETANNKHNLTDGNWLGTSHGRFRETNHGKRAAPQRPGIAAQSRGSYQATVIRAGAKPTASTVGTEKIQEPKERSRNRKEVDPSPPRECCLGNTDGSARPRALLVRLGHEPLGRRIVPAGG